MKGLTVIENVTHADYPHHPGALYDCPACESRCHCEPGAAECVYDGEHERTTVRTAARAWPTSRMVEAEITAARTEDREISDAAAASVAAWWQSPRGHGATFAALCGGLEVALRDLLDAIADARGELSALRLPPGEARLNRLALDMLATWALTAVRGESL